MLQYFCQMNRFFYIRFDDVWNWVDCFASIATRKKKKRRIGFYSAYFYAGSRRKYVAAKLAALTIQ